MFVYNIKGEGFYFKESNRDIMSTSTQGAAGSSGLAAVQEGLCNCDEGV